MSKRVGILLAIFLVLLIMLAGAYYYTYSQQPKQPAKLVNSASSSASLSSPAPTPVNQFRSFRGTTISINKNSLVLQVGSSNQTFDVSQTKDIQKLTLGAKGPNDHTQTVKQIKLTDIKPGQQVAVVVETGSDKVQTIFILD